ncbi:MAG: winged helix-turn-helix transcriptional regulator [Acidimicrobiales bacterium]
MGHEGTPSALDEAVARVGDRWALLVVHALLGGPRRFNDLLGEVGGVASNVLTARLRHLERGGVVMARPYSRRPPRFVYELTASGRELAGALRLLESWGAGRGSDSADALRHDACGTPLEARWWCPTCARMAEDDHADEVRYL